MFGCLLKLILGFSTFLALNQNIHTLIMYECEKSSLTHEIFYIGLFNFSHLNLFHANVICKK
jgi:hypothetical protein